MELINDYITF